MSGVFDDIVNAFVVQFSLEDLNPCSRVESIPERKESLSLDRIEVFVESNESLDDSFFPSVDCDESYVLHVSVPTTVLHVHSAVGLSRAFSTLYQLLRPTMHLSIHPFPSSVSLSTIANPFYSFLVERMNGTVPYEMPEMGSISTAGVLWSGYDYPDYLWRGASLDTVRHYMSMESIGSMLDGMYLSKSNVLHWHLFDGAQFNLQFSKETVCSCRWREWNRNELIMVMFLLLLVSIKRC